MKKSTLHLWMRSLNCVQYPPYTVYKQYNCFESILYGWLVHRKYASSMPLRAIRIEDTVAIYTSW